MKIDSVRLKCSVGSLLFLASTVLAPLAHAEDNRGALLPDAPQPQQTAPASAAQPAQPEEGQTKRILGIMPNFRSVSADTVLPRMSTKDKFVLMYHDSFDYSSFVFTGIMSGVAMSQNSYPEFHQGVAGYGRYFWHNLADGVNGNLMGEAIVPALARQDPRFYTLGKGSAGKRAGYALSRLVVAKADSGHYTFNYGEVIGNGAASGISNFYYPRPYRTWTKTGQRWLINCSTDGLSNLVKEFWPDVNHKLFHQH